MAVVTALESQVTRIGNDIDYGQLIYDHLSQKVSQDCPDGFIEDFRQLFIEARGDKEAQVRQALEKVVNSKQADEQFQSILHRCCHMIINHWGSEPQLQPSIRQFLGLFNELAPAKAFYCRTTRRLRQLVHDFAASERYLSLQRLVRVINNEGPSREAKSVAQLLRRYPYLYEHCLLSESSSLEERQVVSQIQAQAQYRFELDLSRYVAHQVRRAQSVRSQQSSARPRREIELSQNPTMLSERDLAVALKQFVGKVEGECDYRELSLNFLGRIGRMPSYQKFKDRLYEYLSVSVGQSGHQQFNDKLHKKLQATLPDFNSHNVNEFLLIRTCSQLLNFLVVENTSSPNPYILVDLIANLGAARTVSLLMKIVMLCPKIQPNLEKRLAILFRYYESFPNEEVPWLVKVLETLQIALTVYLGRADLSCLKYIM